MPLFSPFNLNISLPSLTPQSTHRSQNQVSSSVAGNVKQNFNLIFGQLCKVCDFPNTGRTTKVS